MMVENMSRSDLECAVLENNILPCGTSAECAALSAMSDADLRAAVVAWVSSGDECAAA